MARPAARRRNKDKSRAQLRVARRGATGAKRTKATSENSREGSALDDFLRDEGLYEATTATAVKETLAWQISEAMIRLGVTKTEMAARMSTSRAALDRLLDPENESVTLATLLLACEALGVELRVGLRARGSR